MSGRCMLVRVLASALFATIAFAEAAPAKRLDDASRALRSPGVWVATDLSWLVSPADARRLDREIDRARVPVRVAVLPQIAIDESRGDQQAIVRGIIERVDRDGLYVLVDQDARVVYAARNLPLDISEYSFPKGSGFDPAPLARSLAAIVPTVRAARRAAAVSFEPFANPRDTRAPSSPDDPLLPVALGAGFLGAALGFAVYWLIRVFVGIAGALRRRPA